MKKYRENMGVSITKIENFKKLTANQVMFCFGVLRYKKGANTNGINICTTFQKATFERFLRPNERYNLLSIKASNPSKKAALFLHCESENNENCDQNFDFGPSIDLDDFICSAGCFENDLLSSCSDEDSSPALNENVELTDKGISADQINPFVCSRNIAAIQINALQFNESSSDSESDSDFNESNEESIITSSMTSTDLLNEISVENDLQLEQNGRIQIECKNLEQHLIDSTPFVNNICQNDEISIKKSHLIFVEKMKKVPLLCKHIDKLAMLQLTEDFLETMTEEELLISLEELADFQRPSAKIISNVLSLIHI